MSGESFEDDITLDEVPAVQRPQGDTFDPFATRAMPVRPSDLLKPGEEAPVLGADFDLGFRAGGEQVDPEAAERAVLMQRARRGVAAVQTGDSGDLPELILNTADEIPADEVGAAEAVTYFAQRKPQRRGGGISDLAAQLECGKVALDALEVEDDWGTVERKFGDMTHFLARKRSLDPAFGAKAPERRYMGPLHILGTDGESYKGLQVKSLVGYQDLCKALLATYSDKLAERFGAQRTQVEIGGEVCELLYISSPFVTLDYTTSDELGVAVSSSGQRYLVRMRQNEESFTPAMLPIPSDSQEFAQYIDFFFKGRKSWGKNQSNDLYIAWLEAKSAS